MDIRGLQKTTLLDFPGKVACTVFTAGCNFRCPFCYNRDLVLAPTKLPRVAEAAFFGFLEHRRGVLDGVVLCGGEPLLQPDLAGFIGEVKRRGFLIKLDTNGSRPEILATLLSAGFLDYVAMDIKGPLEADFYRKVLGEAVSAPSSSSNPSRRAEGETGRDGLDGETAEVAVRQSLLVLLASGVPFELRTTVAPGLHDEALLLRLAQQLRELLSPLSPSDLRYFLQSFEPKTCLDPEFDRRAVFTKGELQEILAALRRILPRAELRGVT